MSAEVCHHACGLSFSAFFAITAAAAHRFSTITAAAVAAALTAVCGLSFSSYSAAADALAQTITAEAVAAAASQNVMYE
jgi:hypothetical protein